jgi:hypothetical protein
MGPSALFRTTHFVKRETLHTLGVRTVSGYEIDEKDTLTHRIIVGVSGIETLFVSDYVHDIIVI